MYLKETSEAAYLTASRVCDQHERVMMKDQGLSSSELIQGVEGLLQHKLSLLEGCKLRVQSMESRAQNVTNLVSDFCPGRVHWRLKNE